MTDWTFDGTWPYEPRWFDSGDGRMHYIDEGPRDGLPVVMVHGNPSWGYLYRHFVGPLVEAGYRCIVPDLLGFGRSDKPTRAEVYTIPRHAGRVEALLESLDLQEATAVVQDWGGPMGLYWVGRHPDRVRSVFIMNTFLHAPQSKRPLPGPLQPMVKPIISSILIKGAHVFVKKLLLGHLRKDRRSATVTAAYLAPHPTWGSRTGIWAFPRQIPTGPDHPTAHFLNEARERLLAANKPVAFAWGMKDPVFPWKMFQASWGKDYPDAPVTRIERAGHFLQEDALDEIVPELLRFLAEDRTGPGRG